MSFQACARSAHGATTAGFAAGGLLASAMISGAQQAVANLREARETRSSRAWAGEAARQEGRAETAELAALYFASDAEALKARVAELEAAVRDRDREVAALRKHNAVLLRQLEDAEREI
jgi:hypothetical protein